MSDPKPNDRQIRQMLTQLHDELERASTLDEDERAMMRHLMADIQETLKHGAGIKANQSFLARLQESIDLLEVNHPTLTATIEKALETLSMAGI
ncbi:MAG TPA: DUF4404 family protein [Anaerolineaceae bacterium]